MTSPDSSHQFTQSTDGSDTIEYVPISRAASVAGVLAVASSLALLSRVFWVVPIVAIVLALVAFRQIAIARDPLSGKGRALFALLTAAFFGSWACGADFYWNDHLRRDAERFVAQWFELLRQGNVEKAQRLALRYDRRTKADDSTKSPKPGAPTRLESFLQQEPVRLILAARDSAKLRSERWLGTHYLDGAIVIGLQLRLEWTRPDGQVESRPIFVEMARFTEPRTSSAYWHLNKVEMIRDSK